MPFVLEPDLLRRPRVLLPLLLYRMFRSGKYREGWSREVPGRGPAPDRRSALPLVPRGQRGRGPAAPAAGPRAGAAAAGLGRRHLDHDHDRPGGGAADLSRPGHVLRPARLQLGDRAGPWPGSGRPCWPWSSWSSGRTWSGRRSGAGAKVAIINGRSAPAATAATASSAGRWARPSAGSTPWPPRTRNMPSGSSTWASPRQRVSVTGSVKYDGLESDRNNARTLDAAQGAGALAGRPGLRGREHDGGGRGRGAGGLPGRAAPASRPPAGPRPAPRRAVRAGGRLARASRARRSLRRSRAGTTAGRGGDPPPVILIDTIGELSAVWGLADVAFVGGSLLPGRGGQNMMEPAAYGASVLFGPHTANFRETVEQLLARERRAAGRRRRGADLRPCSRT